MKLKTTSLALMLVLPVSVMAQSLSFKQCVDMTLAQNPEMQVSSERIAQAQSALNEAKAARLPQITASVTAAHSDNALNAFGMKLQQRDAALSDFGFDNTVAQQFGAGNFAHKPHNLNNADAHTDVNTRIEMLLPIWNGGKISSYQNQARAMIQAASHGEEAVKQYLTFNVYQAYEGVHTARAFIEVAKKAVEAATSYVKTTQNLVEQGILVKSELLTAKVHLADAQAILEKARTEEEIALDSLKMLMAMDSGEQLEVGASFDLQLPADSIGELLGLANNSNPKLDAMREEARSSVEAISAADADNYPSFNLMARHDWNDDSLGLDASSYTVAAVASWKLTDFGATKSKVDRAQAAANEKRAKAKSEENMVRLEVLKAWRNLQVTEKQARMKRTAVKQAEEAQRLVMKRYKNGVSTMTEVLTSQTQLDKARADLVKIQYEANVFKAKLRLATGTLELSQL